jgi:hypothetical protein
MRELRNAVERVVTGDGEGRSAADDLPTPGSADGATTPTRLDFASYKEGRDAYERNYILRKLAEAMATSPARRRR